MVGTIHCNMFYGILVLISMSSYPRPSRKIQILSAMKGDSYAVTSTVEASDRIPCVLTDPPQGWAYVRPMLQLDFISLE